MVALTFDRFDESQDGADFRDKAFSYLSAKYSKNVSAALKVLSGEKVREQYPMDNLWQIHLQQIKPEYLFRHSLPFCITEDNYFNGGDRHSASYLAGLLLGYTMVLGQLDYFFDGNEPQAGRGNAPIKLAQARASAFSVKSVYSSIGLLAKLKNGPQVIDYALAPFGNFVTSRLFQDYLEKYDQSLLAPPINTKEYLESPTSSLFASSYWEVMIRGSFASHHKTLPRHMSDIILSLRKLRQIVDEIADLEDDIIGGSLTLPTLMLLSDKKHHAQTSQLILQIWDHSRTQQQRETAAQKLHLLLVETGVFSKIFELARAEWRQTAELADERLGEQAGGLLILLDIKFAKLSAIENNGWKDIKTSDYFLCE